MTTYTITVGDRGDGIYGFDIGFGGSVFGSVSPPDGDVVSFIWANDGSGVAIISYGPAGTEVAWNGHTYILNDEYSPGYVYYSNVGLGGPYPTSGTTTFSFESSSGIVGALAASVPLSATVSGNVSGVAGTLAGSLSVQTVISGVTQLYGTLAATLAVTASFNNYTPITGTVSGSISVSSTTRGYILPNGPGIVTLTSGSSWTVPANWNNAVNKVWCVGASGSSSAISFLTGGAGAGAGAFAGSTNLTLTPGASISYQVGPGLDTVFGGTTLGSCLVGAQKGSNATGTTGGAGGLASASVGTVTYNGGSGANGASISGFYPGSGGGGGAAGPNGAGDNGTTPVSFGQIGAGGSGDAGTGGAGGVTGDGAAGTEWDGVVGSGGGGAGADGVGGFFGAAPGGGPNGMSGTQGLIYIQYTPLGGPRSFGFIIG